MKLTDTRNLVYGFILLIVAYIVLFRDLGVLPLQIWDEARNADTALEMLLNGNFLVPHYDGQPEMWSTKPPLYIWIAVMSMKVFGINEFAVRLPSALSAFALLLYLYFFCKKYLQSNTAGFLACLVMLTSVGLIDYHVARNADYDAMLTLFVFVFCTELYLYLENGRNKHLYVAALCLTLAILTKSVAALLVGPGVLVACMMRRSYRQAVFKVKTILIMIAAFVVALSYYLIREMFSDGYIKAVIVNEITGRYGKVSEGHVGPPWYYLKGFVSPNYMQPNYLAWVAFLPVAFLTTQWSGNRKIKSLGQYIGIVSIMLLVVLSSSATKISWYDAQLYPFWALLIGIFLWVFLDRVTKITDTPWKNTLLATLFGLAIFSMPVYFMSKTSIRKKNVNLHSSLLYGPSFNEFYKRYPANKKLYVYSEGYNSALKFYENKYKNEKKNIVVTDTCIFRKGDTVLTCGYMNKDKLVNKYSAQMLIEYGEQYTLYIAENLQN